jgi:galactose mutarotase-like enzyme
MNLQTFQGQPVILLSSASSQAIISPAKGGQLVRWTQGDWTIIGWPDDANWQEWVHGGNQVLFPFIARTYANGKIGSWTDSAGVTRSASMHGFAKDLPFHVVDGGADFVRLRQDASDITRREYPFDYRLEVTHRLTGGSLATTFRIENRGGGSMPWTAGHHYYFHVPAQQRAEWILNLPCEQWATQDFSDGSYSFAPAACNPAPLDRAEWIERMQLKPNFPNISLRHAPSGRELAFEALHAGDWPVVTTWTAGRSENFFCVEPWSALPNAVHNGHGLRFLAAGDSCEVGCVVRAKSPQ